MGTDRKGPQPQLSIKGKDDAETAEAMAEYNKALRRRQSGTTKLGALLREQLNSKSEDRRLAVQNVAARFRPGAIFLGCSCPPERP